MTTHYRYGGSTAGRTLACPAWHGLADGMPKPPSSKAAELGTALHSIIELCLLDIDINPYDFVGTVRDKVLITEDHITDKITPALEAFEVLMDTYEIERYWCEVTARIAPDIGGTADFVGLSADGKTLLVADYKSGDGLMVDAEDNSQGLFYALCLQLDKSKSFAALIEKVDEVIIAIVQPSHRRAETLDIWETKPVILKAFKHNYDKAVTLSRSDNTEPVAGDHCKWCPAEATCPAKTCLVVEAERLPAESLVLAQLSEALDVASKLESWIKAVRKLAQEQLSLGATVSGHKLVMKRASRVWNDPTAVAKKIRYSKKLKMADCYTSKLVSPPQMEKVLKTHELDYKEFEPFVSSVSSGTTLVKTTDKRPAVLVTDGEKFAQSRFA